MKTTYQYGSCHEVAHEDKSGDIVEVSQYCSDSCAQTDEDYDGWNGCQEIEVPDGRPIPVCESCGEPVSELEFREFILNGAFGQYLPQAFALSEWGQHIANKDDRKILLEGPEAEWYWDAWADVLDEWTHDGLRLEAGESGDLFLIGTPTTPTKEG